MRQNEASRETRKKEKMERELKQLQNELEFKVADIKTMQQGLNKNKEELLKCEQQLKEQKVFLKIFINTHFKFLDQDHI